MTLPAFRHRVQTYTRRGALPTMILTFWRFGSKRRFVATIEWLRLLPNAGPFPQLWHILAIEGCSLEDGSGLGGFGRLGPGQAPLGLDARDGLNPVDLAIGGQDRRRLRGRPRPQHPSRPPGRRDSAQGLRAATAKASCTCSTHSSPASAYASSPTTETNQAPIRTTPLRSELLSPSHRQMSGHDRQRRPHPRA